MIEGRPRAILNARVPTAPHRFGAMASSPIPSRASPTPDRLCSNQRQQKFLMQPCERPIKHSSTVKTELSG